MDAGHDVPSASRAWAALAGFTAGMLGAIVLLAVVGLASLWTRHSFWYPAGVIASTFYGDDAISIGLHWSTLSGVAVLLILYSLFGAVFGAVMQGAGWGLRRLMMLGIVSGAAWYYLWFGLLWKRLNPLVPLYTHDAPMFWGHLVYGALLARFGLYYRRFTAVPSPLVMLPAALPEPAAADSVTPPEA